MGPAGPAGPAGADGSEVTPDEILAKLLTVAGSGSHLDADSVDGRSADEIQGACVQKAGDTMMGELDAPSVVAGQVVGTDVLATTVRANVVMVGTTTVACDGSRMGALSFDTTTRALKVCNGTKWMIVQAQELHYTPVILMPAAGGPLNSSMVIRWTNPGSQQNVVEAALTSDFANAFTAFVGANIDNVVANGLYRSNGQRITSLAPGTPLYLRVTTYTMDGQVERSAVQTNTWQG